MNNFIHVSDLIINTDSITLIIGNPDDSCVLELDKNRYDNNHIHTKTHIEEILDSLHLAGGRFIRISGSEFSDSYAYYLNVKHINHICPGPNGNGSIVYCDESTGLKPSYQIWSSFAELLEQL